MNSCPEVILAPEYSRPPAWWGALVIAAVPLASFLSFSVQPLVGKFLVPWHGGSASTWIGVMLFFQGSLLAGYLWAYWLGRRSGGVQAGATLALSAVAALAIQLPPPRLLSQNGMAEVLLSITVALLPAMLLLFSAGLMMQAWVARSRGRIPYYLYGVSNLGSLGALVIYPLWIEPNVGLSLQATVWRWLFVLLAMLLVAMAWSIRRERSVATHSPLAEPAEEIPLDRKLVWLGLSATTCVCMLGATRHLSAEIGSNPLSWIIPLGIYLGSFSLTFSGWWREQASLVSLALLAVSLSGFTLLKGITATPLSEWTALWLVMVVGAGCCFGHGMLYARRPRQQFLHYYVVIAAGGVIGGVFSSLSAPNLFSRDFEFIGAAAILLSVGTIQVTSARTGLKTAVAIAVVAAPLVAALWTQQRADRTALQRVHHFRNLYGTIRVTQRPSLVSLESETTWHGSQMIQPEAARRKPTSYYIESSAVGTVLQRLGAVKPVLNIGIVGLGAGTLATYARPQDTFTFWDLDPKVIWVARTAFSYLADAQGKVEVEEADGRMGLAASMARYDALVIDAFSGDSIPSHLLTVEAFRLYLAKLQPDGILLVHASNRYVDLFPLIAGNASRLGWEAVRILTRVTGPGAERDFGPAPSNYIVVHSPALKADIDTWFPAQGDNGRVRREIERLVASDPRLKVWTDDRNSIRDVLDLRSYLQRER